MRRVRAVLASACVLSSACLVLIAGCRDYDIRLEKTLEEMKYQLKLERNLEKAPQKGNLPTEHIFVRAPKGLIGPTQTFSLVALEPGKFDVETSFIDQAKQSSLHVLARVKKPKPTAKKGTPAPDVAQRGDFTADVIDVVKAAYAVEDLTPSKFKAVTKRHESRENNFKEVKLDLNTKEVLIYLYGDKNAPHNVALIFEYPKSEVSSLSTRIGLALEAFAVGPAADQAYSGGGESEGTEGGGGESSQAVPV
jgi:hypothetical protein